MVCISQAKIGPGGPLFTPDQLSRERAIAPLPMLYTAIYTIPKSRAIGYVPPISPLYKWYSVHTAVYVSDPVHQSLVHRERDGAGTVVMCTYNRHCTYSPRME